MAAEQTTALAHWVDSLRDVDPDRRQEVRQQLINHAYDRLRKHTCRILNRSFPSQRGNTDELHQDVMLRLYGALETFTPISVAAFFDLAARHIRYELLERIRQARRQLPTTDRQQPSAGSSTGASADPSQVTYDPTTLEAWSEFHELIEHLPEELREIINLLFYCGLTQNDAAKLLEVPESTVQSRWRRARVQLAMAMQSTLPDCSVM